MDPMTKMKQLERRRQLVDAMTAQNLRTPIESGGSTAMGIGQLLAKLGTSAILGAQERGVGEQEAAARSEYQQGLQGASQRFMDLLQGRKGDTMSDQQVADLMLRDQAPQLRDEVKADPRQAIVEAMSSQYPEMQQLGMAHLKGMGAQKPYEDSNIGNKRVRTYADGRTEVLGDFTEKWGEPFDINVDGKTIKVQRNEASGQLRQVGTSAPQAIVNMGDKGDLNYLGEVDKAIGPQGKSYESAKAAGKDLSTINQTLSAVERGARTGTAEPLLQSVRGLARQIGIEFPSTGPTGEAEALLAGRVFDRLGGLGVAVSDADREFVLKAAGSLGTNPDALRVLLAYQAAANMVEVSRHNLIVDQRAAASDRPEIYEASRIKFGQKLGDDKFADMVERVLAGLPAMETPPAAAPGQAPATPQAPQQGPIIRNW